MTSFSNLLYFSFFKDYIYKLKGKICHYFYIYLVDSYKYMVDFSMLKELVFDLSWLDESRMRINRKRVTAPANYELPPPRYSFVTQLTCLGTRSLAGGTFSLIPFTSDFCILICYIHAFIHFSFFLYIFVFLLNELSC